MLKLLDWLLLERETIELSRINEIYEAVNEHKICGKQILHAIYRHKWKFHHEKLDLLVFLSTLNK